VLRLKSLLGLSLEEVKDLLEAEEARAALRREWQAGVEDPVRRRQILEQSLGYIAGQLELTRRRRDEIGKLEDELVARRKRVRELLRELDVTAVEVAFCRDIRGKRQPLKVNQLQDKWGLPELPGPAPLAGIGGRPPGAASSFSHRRSLSDGRSLDLARNPAREGYPLPPPSNSPCPRIPTASSAPPPPRSARRSAC
jgi:DNA-binding transcriptional MerR regulator